MDPEIIVVDDDADGVSCDGGGGPLGHPKVWYSLSNGYSECGYCDRVFVKRSREASLRKALIRAA